VPTQPVPLTGRETGIAVGLTVFLVTADDLAVDNPRHLRKAEQALKRADRRVARRTILYGPGRPVRERWHWRPC
jgi:putative transposase